MDIYNSDIHTVMTVSSLTAFFLMFEFCEFSWTRFQDLHLTDL